MWLIHVPTFYTFFFLEKLTNKQLVQKLIPSMRKWVDLQRKCLWGCRLPALQSPAPLGKALSMSIDHLPQLHSRKSDWGSAGKQQLLSQQSCPLWLLAGGSPMPSCRLYAHKFFHSCRVCIWMCHWSSHMIPTGHVGCPKVPSAQLLSSLIVAKCVICQAQFHWIADARGIWEPRRLFCSCQSHGKCSTDRQMWCLRCNVM
jgi:hypothetical protein